MPETVPDAKPPSPSASSHSERSSKAMTRQPNNGDTRLRASSPEIPLKSAGRARAQTWRDRLPTIATPAAGSDAGRASPETLLGSVLPTSHSLHRLLSDVPVRTLAECHRRGAHGQELKEVLREQQVQCPVDGHSALLLESRQLAQVNRSPEPPGGEA